MASRLRELQRADTEAAILDAAWHRYAAVGPDGTSVREVASDAGCTHALIARYYGSKEGLVEAVQDRLAHGVDSAVTAALAGDEDPIADILSQARRNRSCVQLLIRGGLGDLGPAVCPAVLHAARVLSATSSAAVGGERRGTRRKLCSYGAASLILGWLTFEDFAVAAVGLGQVSGRRRDLCVTSAARRVLGLARSRTPSLSGALRVDQELLEPPKTAPNSARSALVDAALELFARHGPASVSVRDVGRRAGVNPGLIYRHFGSKDELLAAAFDQGTSEMLPAVLAPDGFDIDTVVHQIHHGSPQPRLIARILVDDVEIGRVRKRFPVLRRLLDVYDPLSRTGRSPDLTDPRVAVASAACMALGSAIFGRDLRRALDLPDDGSTEMAIAALGRVLLAEPLGAHAATEPG